MLYVTEIVTVKFQKKQASLVSLFRNPLVTTFWLSFPFRGCFTSTVEESYRGFYNISTFQTSYFYTLESRFFVLEYRKQPFPGLYC